MKRGLEDSGFTLIELLIVVGIIGILAAIAVPGLLKARTNGNEASAIAGLRAVSSSQQSYYQFCGGYGTTLPHLGFTPAGSTHPFLPADMTAAAVVMKSGYRTSVVAGAGYIALTPTNGCPAAGSSYYATAEALTFGATGSRTFATNGAGAIWQNTASTPPPEPFTMGGTISPLR